MSGFAPLQQALVAVIKAEVQTAVADKYQAEIDNLRDALAVAQRDLDHTRAILDELRAAFTAAESTAALELYAEGLRLRFPVLGAATKLCGTSDPWIIQELLNESAICRETPRFDSFGRFVLHSHRGHPVYKVKHNVWGVRRLQSAIREYAPRAFLGFGVPSHSETEWNTLPADFRIFEAPGQTPEFDWDKVYNTMPTPSTTQAAINTRTSSFGGHDAELAARLAAPSSPTEAGTDHAAAEARRRTSDWSPPQQNLQRRNTSFDHEEHKRQMMAASGTLQMD
ncbi:hypothetical protein VPNG_04090 [Cytospora leucostoma]|uniref:Uncharacterized protein n=1 Tax=Cytospora leucostoma TaxID=1230097 RepID=A0A423XDA1_9PEZI|nr:hypothetical protein VPNG_04090 [Cytospora leucostoma]